MSTNKSKQSNSKPKVKPEKSMETRGLSMVQPLPLAARKEKPFRMAADNMPKFTSAGNAFLKAAFAPVDFDGINLLGIPDAYEGKSLVKKHKLTTSLTLDASKDTYFLLAPVPGTAYFKATANAGVPIVGGTAWYGVDYTDTVTLFPTPEKAAENFSRFRFISNHIEIVPTVNETSWTGSITLFKVKLQLNPRASIASGSGVNNLFNISGLDDANSTLVQNYAAPFRDGCFSGAFSIGPSMDFTPIIEGYSEMPAAVILGPDFGQLSCQTTFPGLDNNFESIMIRIQGVGTNANNSFLLRTWASVEYSVLSSSALYEYATGSPRDDMALAYYRQIIKQLPVGVAYYDNANFWQRVLSIIRGVSSVLKFIPGPYGMIAGGVHELVSS